MLSACDIRQALQTPACGNCQALQASAWLSFECGNHAYEKFLLKITSGTSDANIQFEELLNLLKQMGFEERTSGSHHVFRKEGVVEKINLQKDGNKAKPYQVKQARNVIIRYKLGGKH